MVLDGDSLFGKNNPYTKQRRFILTRKFYSQLPVAEGNVITGDVNQIASGLGLGLEDIGVYLSFSITNYSGAPRTITMTLTNVTKSTTLYASGDYVISGTGTVSIESFYSLKEISSADVIRLTIGGDGIGTAVGAPILGSIFFELNSIYEIEDETSTGT